MAKIVTRGSGITAREQILFDMTGNHPADEAAVVEGLNSFSATVERNNGFFGMVSEEAHETCKLVLSENSDGGNTVEDGPEYYAALITKLIRVASKEIEAKNADKAARFAFRAGLEWGLAQMKWQWEPDAMRGVKVAKGLRSAAQQTNARHATLREKRFARMKKIAPNLGAENAARACEAEGLGGWQGILRQWNRHWASARQKNADT